MNRAFWLLCAALVLVFSASAAEPKLRNTLRGHTWVVYSVAYSPDGKTLASGSSDRTVRLWDVATGKNAAILEARGGDWVTSVAWSPNGKALASGGYDGTVRLWNVASRTNVATLEGHKDCVTSVAWRRDGKTLASGSCDGTVKVWDVASGKEIADLAAHSGGVWCVAWTPGGRTLASGGEARILPSGLSDGAVKLWNVANGKSFAALSDDEDTGDIVFSVAFSPDGKILASGQYSTITLWDVASRKITATLTGHSNDQIGEVSPAVLSVAFSPDGKTVASGSRDKTIKLWDVASGKEIITLTGHSGAIESVAWSPDGKALASASNDGTIRLWDVSALRGSKASN